MLVLLLFIAPLQRVREERERERATSIIQGPAAEQKQGTYVG